MKSARNPARHVLVCVNRRGPDSPLGEGCGARGEGVYETCKRFVSEKGLIRELWVSRTHCLGLCPKRGTTLAVYPDNRWYTEVVPDDVRAILETSGS